MEIKLCPSSVREILGDCFLGVDQLSDGKPKADVKYITVEGISRSFGFDPDKISKYTDDIKTMIDCLDRKFFDGEGDGGGYTFLDLPFTKDDKQWGEQNHAEELLVLAIASGYADYLFPRSFWHVLPGGVPYIILHDKPHPVDITVAE